jgi:DNA-binding MarR family transcriptional regulator
MSATTSQDSQRCSYVVDDDGLATWSDVHRDAWIGLLETHKQLTRALDAELEDEYALSLSALEVLGRLAAAEGRSLRLSELASACGLSLSRVSRIIDALVARGLVERRCVPSDARAVDGHLTDAGMELVRRAQGSHFASVQQRFFEQLSDDETRLLSSIFSRFAARAAESCTTGE